MKKQLILLIVFSLTLIFLSGQDLYKQSLIDLATIEFPSTPETLDTLGQKVYSYSDQDASYLAIVVDMSKQSGFQLEEGRLYKLYDGFVDGTIEASNGKLISKKRFNLNGLEGVAPEKYYIFLKRNSTVNTAPPTHHVPSAN